MRDQLGVPVIGVIEPGVRAMLSATTSGHVGVIGTVGTISSGAYQRVVAAMSDEVKLTCAACPGFVEFVERGDIDGDQVHVLAERLLAPMQDAGIDTLLLGCTHYPYLARTIARCDGPRRGAGVVGRRDRLRAGRRPGPFPTCVDPGRGGRRDAAPVVLLR